MSIPRVLVIAGSDSSGGAGLEADQRVLTAHGCYAMTATTALTAQNTTGVVDIHVTPPAFLQKQIKACLEDIDTDVVKIGMLASKETIDAVADALAEFKVPAIVLDPVMVATTGGQLLPPDAIETLTRRLLSTTTVLTPNIPEALLLLKQAGISAEDPQNIEDLKILTSKVQTLGSKTVLLKGGHLPLTQNYERAESKETGELVVDILYDGQVYTKFERPFTPSKNTHGTGCSLASAIAANIAKGLKLEKAIESACSYVHAGIKLSFDIGKGNGPINHLHSLQHMPFAPGDFVEYLLGREDVQEVWKKYTYHKFVQDLGRGVLPVEVFKRFLIQDYLYLTHFARSNSLAANKAKSMDTIAASAQIVLHIKHESQLHLDYCATFGLSKADIEKEKESLACVAYSRFILDVGYSEDWFALQIALSPCLFGYGQVATRLHGDVESVKEGNKYWKWVENYVADDYMQAVVTGSKLLNEHIYKQSPSRIEELVKIFIRATEMEVAFWDAALNLSP